MYSKLQLFTASAIPPITLQQAKDQCRVDTTAEDTYLTALVLEATNYIQQNTNLQLITAIYKQYLDEFPVSDKPIRLRSAPLQSITSITYVDTAGVTQTWAATKYEADQRKIPGEVRPIESESYPDTKDVVNAVVITFKSGFGDATVDVPENILRAVKLLVNFWYDKRLTVTAAGQDIDIPKAVQSLLNLHNLYGFN
mgnify:CR=1 FL=1